MYGHVERDNADGPMDLYMDLCYLIFRQSHIYQFIRLILIGPETPAVLTATPPLTSLRQLQERGGGKMPSGWRILCQFLSTNSGDGGPLGVLFMPIPSAETPSQKWTANIIKNSNAWVGFTTMFHSVSPHWAEPIKYGIKTDSPPKP